MGLPSGCFEGAVGGAVLGTTTTVMLAATGALLCLFVFGCAFCIFPVVHSGVLLLYGAALETPTTT